MKLTAGRFSTICWRHPAHYVITPLSLPPGWAGGEIHVVMVMNVHLWRHNILLLGIFRQHCVVQVVDRSFGDCEVIFCFIYTCFLYWEIFKYFKKYWKLSYFWHKMLKNEIFCSKTKKNLNKCIWLNYYLFWSTIEIRF